MAQTHPAFSKERREANESADKHEAFRAQHVASSKAASVSTPPAAHSSKTASGPRGEPKGKPATGRRGAGGGKGGYMVGVGDKQKPVQRGRKGGAYTVGPGGKKHYIGKAGRD